MATLESLADAPGKLREYETIFILAPDTANDGVASVNDRLKGIVENLGGKVLKVDNWGKRRLAYEVKKHLKGIYLYWQYLGTTGLVDELERNLRMLDPCIRYMTVKVDADVDPGARPSEMDEEAYARAATTAADEEDLMMGHVDRSSLDEPTAAASDDEIDEPEQSAAPAGDDAAPTERAETAEPTEETETGDEESEQKDG